MGLGYRRRELQALAEGKIQDAQLLLSNGRFANSYYLAGYAVELGLKACLAKQIAAETIPDKQFMKNFITHDFKQLVALAGLSGTLKAQQADAEFAANWAIVCEWEPDSRYVATDRYSAQYMLSAIVDPRNGVLEWIKANW